MYDLIDIIDTKLNGMDHLISKWMTNNSIVKLTLINDIKTIKNTINKYHNQYVVCNNYQKYGTCKYGAYCWYLHPTSYDNKNTNNNISSNISNNINNNSDDTDDCNDSDFDGYDNSWHSDNDYDDIIECEHNNNNKKQTKKRKRKRKRKNKKTKQKFRLKKIKDDLKQTKDFFDKKDNMCKDTQIETVNQKDSLDTDTDTDTNTDTDTETENIITNKIISDHKYMDTSKVSVKKNQLLKISKPIWFRYFKWFYNYTRPNNTYFKDKENFIDFIENKENLNSLKKQVGLLVQFQSKPYVQIHIKKLFEIEKNNMY